MCERLYKCDSCGADVVRRGNTPLVKRDISMESGCPVGRMRFRYHVYCGLEECKMNLLNLTKEAAEKNQKDVFGIDKPELPRSLTRPSIKKI